MASLLFVTTRLPYPPWEGHQIRSFNLLKALCEEHDVHLLSFMRKDDREENIHPLRAVCASVETVTIPGDRLPLLWTGSLLRSLFSRKPFVVHRYHAPEMAGKIERFLHRCNPDVVHLDMLPLAQYHPLCDGRPVVLNEHNVESLLLERRSENRACRGVCRLFFSSQAGKLQRFERWACQAVTQVLACSPDDAAVLRSFANETPVEVVPNGVDVDYFSPGEPGEVDPCELVFVGGMGWFPNRDGMDFFLREVMPVVMAREPRVRCTVVGKGEGLSIPARVAEKVKMTGFVEDIRPYVRRAGIYIVPLRVGSGTRLKLLEAMSMAKPIVSTPLGCEGVAVEHERELLIARDPMDQADAILRLMKDPGFGRTLGARARQKALALYDWKVIGERLRDVYRRLLASGRQ